MTSTDDWIGAGIGLLGVALVVSVAEKALKIADKIPKPKEKGEKIKW